MPVDSKNEDNSSFGLRALLLAIEEIEGKCNNEHMKSNRLGSKSPHIDPSIIDSETSEKSQIDNETVENEEHSIKNESSTENDIFPLGLQALLVAIEEMEKTQHTNEKVIGNNSSSSMDIDSPFIGPEISRLESPAVKQPCFYSPPDLDVFEPGLHREKNMSTTYSIYNSTITPQKQSPTPKQNESYCYLNNLSENSDFSTLQVVSKDEKEKCDLKCSECGVNVELLNQDPTFSTAVHMQSHRIDEVSNYLGPEFNCDMSTDYICPDCNLAITLFNNDIDFSFERHFTSCPKKDTTTTPEERIKLNKKFIDEVFSCLGNDFKTDYSYIEFESSELYCKACKCGIATSTVNVIDTSVSLRAHLSLLFHKDLVNVLNGFEQDMDQYVDELNEKKPTHGTNSQIYHSERKVKGNAPNDGCARKFFATLELTDISKFIPRRYNIHCKYFSLSKDSIYCNICFLYVEGIEYLTSHIKSSAHKIAFFNQIKKSMPDKLKLQVKFLIIVEERLFCTRCKVAVSLLENFDSVCIDVLGHFQSCSHLQI